MSSERERYEKETGNGAYILKCHVMGATDEYVTWLEQRIAALQPAPAGEVVEYVYKSFDDFIKQWREATLPITGEKRPWKELLDQDVWKAARARLTAATAPVVEQTLPVIKCRKCGKYAIEWNGWEFCECGYRWNIEAGKSPDDKPAPVDGAKIIRKLEDTMVDSAIPNFFKRATGRKYTERETCVNDIRRMLMCFYNDRLLRKPPAPVAKPEGGAG